MSMKRWGFVLLLTLSTAALAEPSSEPLASREKSSPESLTCMVARCSASYQCENYCPEAETAVCVSGYCQYTYPTTGGGGGGGGGGGPVCQAARCSSASPCICEGVQYACVNGYCQY